MQHFCEKMYVLQQCCDETVCVVVVTTTELILLSIPSLTWVPFSTLPRLHHDHHHTHRHPADLYYDDLIGIFSSWAIQIYKLVTQENKNSILDIINRPQWWKTRIIFCKCYVHVLYSLCFCLSRKVIISLYLR